MPMNLIANRYHTIVGDPHHTVYFNTEDLSPVNLISIWDGEVDVTPYVPTVLDYIDTVRVLREFAKYADHTGAYRQIFKAIWDIEALLCEQT